MGLGQAEAMIRTLKLTGAALALLLAPAQGTQAQGTQARAATPLAPLVLVDGSWSVTRLPGGQTMPGGVKALLNFVGGRLSGTTGCNAVSGRYTHSGTTLTVQSLVSTRKACLGPAGPAETLIQKSLNGAQQVYVYGPIGQRSMRLSGSGGTLYLVKR